MLLLKYRSQYIRRGTVVFRPAKVSFMALAVNSATHDVTKDRAVASAAE
jgi:hypothetical protein